VQYRAVASYSERVAKDFDLAYRDVRAGGGRYILGFQVNWFKNPFARFFGIGNDIPEQDETNYTSREFWAKGTIGINFGPDVAMLFTERYHEVRVEQGILTTLLDTKTKLAGTNLPGLEGARILGHQLMVRYDTRDNLLTPSKGSYVAVSLELSQNLQLSEPDRWGRYIVDARHLIPHGGGRMVFGARFLIDGVTGDRIPFYERPTLGGENTLRAFGLSRFIDDWATVLNVEERIIVKEQRVFDHLVGLEISPFLDMGRVSSNLFDQLRRIQVNPGVGFRLVQKPNVVGRLDVAYGRDGSNAFVGLDYPF
jgi:outer membrane protein assembly factor BamA